MPHAFETAYPTTDGAERRAQQSNNFKSLIYGGQSGAQVLTPTKKSGRGAVAHLSHQEAPFAQHENMKSENYPANYTKKRATQEVMDKVGNKNDSEMGFDPAVYAANRAANAENRLYSRSRNFVGSGNILTHIENEKY